MMTLQGLGLLCFILREQKAALNAAGYIDDVLERHVRPLFQLVFLHQPIIYQHNSAPCRKARPVSFLLTAYTQHYLTGESLCFFLLFIQVRAWLNDSSITVMDWQAQSPDLNPVEHLWKLLNKMRIIDFEKLLNGAEEAAWKDDELNQHCAALVAGMPRRIEACITAKGGYTKY